MLRPNYNQAFSCMIGSRVTQRCFFLFLSSLHSLTTTQVHMSSTSDSLPPLPENRTVVGVGGMGVDFLAAVNSFPKPDDKIRTTSFKVQGGGNACNTLVCVARLGLSPRIISKVADDAHGRGLLQELQADGVDTSFVVVADEGKTPFSYIIVDRETNTRTCLFTPGYPPMLPKDLSPSSVSSAVDGARLAYFDGRLPEIALLVAQEAARRNIPILIDAERVREGLDDLLNLAEYAICSVKFPKVWTKAKTFQTALVSMLLKLPKLKFAIVTLGEEGCIMIMRSTEDSHTEEMDVDTLFESLKQRKDDSITIPTYISSPVKKLRANGIGIVSGRLFVGTAEKIPSSELIDTTGAGDSFIGAVIYALCNNMPPEKMLPFAAQVAAACCRGLGSRTSLPYRTNPLLALFM